MLYQHNPQRSQFFTAVVFRTTKCSSIHLKNPFAEANSFFLKCICGSLPTWKLECQWEYTSEAGVSKVSTYTPGRHRFPAPPFPRGEQCDHLPRVSLTLFVRETASLASEQTNVASIHHSFESA